VVGRYNRDGIDSFPLGARLYVDETTSMGLARETAAPARVEDWGTSEGELAGLMLQLGYRSTVSAPIIVAGNLWGAVTIGSADPLPPNTEFRLSAFCDLVSLAVASAQAREDLQTSRARIVRAGDEQRRRLERNLHDGAQQRLVTLSVALGLEAARADPAAAEALSRAQDEVEQAIAELRELARGIHPTLLRDEGLQAAVEALARRAPLPVTVQGTLTDRLPDPAELAAYFVVSEALTNIVKHATATQASVLLEREPGLLRVTVADDGAGGARMTAGSGLAGLRDRLDALDATLAIESPAGEGTTIRAELPCES
jgi:signal transduction histidine kinase